MKIVFLDIDGVLNYNESKIIDNKCLEYLEEIINKTNAKIVLISTWRQFLDDNILNDLNEEFKISFLKYRDLLNKIFKNNMSIFDVVENYFSSNKFKEISNTNCSEYRSLEIKEWLSRKNDIESFVIIDDFDSGYSKYYPNNWVRTSWIKNGLGEKERDRAIEILNKTNNSSINHN